MAAAIRLSQQHSCSFNHLVGEGDKRIRQRDAKQCRRLQIDGHVKALRLLNRHFGWLGAARKLVDVESNILEQSNKIETVTDQRSGLCVLAKSRDRWNVT